MLPGERLRDKFLQVEGKPYQAFRDLAGAYRFPLYVLYVDHVQPEAFAALSRFRVRVDIAEAQFPRELWSSRARRIALEDYVARRFHQAIRRHVKGRRGAGHSGMIVVDAGGQEVLERTACRIQEDWIEVRFEAGLPADGRKASGKHASGMLLEELPKLAEEAMRFSSLDPAHARRHVEIAEDHAALQAALAPLGLVAFVGDGSLLARESALSDRPHRARAVAFESPPDLRVSLETPNSGRLSGMGVPTGVTLIAGGGFQGKTTLVRAIARGIYPHVPGDGRERVATVPDAVLIRAEEGRRVEAVDLSPFLGPLPSGAETAPYSVEHAAGAVAEAANVVEALEAGTHLVILDEDASAPTFLVRDDLMRRLAPASPMTPYRDRARQLLDERGLSTVVAAGATGEYLPVADTVILLDGYRPRVVTEQARALARDRSLPAPGPLSPTPARAPLPGPLATLRDRKIDVRGLRALVVGREQVELGAVEQIVDQSQTRAIGEAIRYALESGLLNGERTIREILDALEAALDQGGLEVLGASGALARPRRQEIAAAINRLRGLQVRRPGEPLPQQRDEDVQPEVGGEVGEHRGEESAPPVEPAEGDAGHPVEHDRAGDDEGGERQNG